MAESKIISIVLEPETIEKIKKMQLEKGILSRSEMIRYLIDQGFKGQVR